MSNQFQNPKSKYFDVKKLLINGFGVLAFDIDLTFDI